KSQTDFVTLPSRAVTITKDNDDVSMGTGSSAGRFYFKKPGTATISVVSKDNGKTKDLKVTSNYVKVERIESTDIKTFDIDGWNNSEECYRGLAADKTYTVLPENASNKEVTWIDKTPEVATKIDGTFSKGLVPKKNGQADFIVTSVDNSAINHTVSINFKYKNPAKTVSADPNEITVEANASVPLKLTFEPDNATEQRFNWTYDQDGIVEVKDKIVSDFFGKTTEHTLRAIKEGTVTVTGTPWDTSGSAQKVTFKVTVSKGSGEAVDVKKMTKEGITSGQQFINTLGNNAYEAEWNIFAMARSGGDIGEGNIESWYDDVVSKTQAGTYLNNPIDIARVVLAVNASGRDATNIGGINLIEKLYNAPNLLNETSNAICFALISIDTKNYTLPNDALYTREKIIEELLLFQKESGGFGLSKEGTIATVDMTAMILQSLSTYN
ncbi:MAG: Ig-like domain-containing protein, partial [Eubacterium sp.]